MKSNWVDTTTDEEAARVHFGMWDLGLKTAPDGSQSIGSNGPTENGEFWTFELARVKHDPDRRYAVARNALPIPAAWRECSIALRAKIRENRKAGEPYTSELENLHRLSALASIEMPYDWLALVPFSRLDHLDVRYTVIGCDKLETLNATDRKWMREIWGEPKTHATAKSLYPDFYRDECARAKKVEADHQAARRAAWDRSIDALIEEGGSPMTSTIAEDRTLASSARPYPAEKKSGLSFLVSAIKKALR